MSDRPPTFATTLSNGIQDIAALLPLLGTEQCEQHIGSALQKGFLYAAVAPLSIFGSLGIVKAAFAAMLATVTYPFYGGRWLDDAGFATPGSVSSMVTIAKDTGKYGAEVALGKLLKEQHIDDPTLVKGFSWLGWKEEDKGQRERNRTRKIAGDEDGDGYSDTGCLFSWNMMLIHCTLLCAILSVTPYLYVMSSHWDRPLSWIFPLLRSFGSFACVVATQLVLQLRIHRIANTSLQWLKLQRKYGFEDESHPSAQVLEDRIRQQFRLHPSISLFVHLSRQSTIDAEAGEGTDGSFANCPLEDEEILDLEERFAADWRLILYQFILAIGIEMVVTGYVGCFSLVAQSDVVNAPYVWLALETTLSVVRTFVWGSNPAWDESTGLKMTLELEPSTSKGVSETPFPLITSPHDEARLRIDTPQPFTAHNEADFLGMATAWVGPLQRLEPGSATLFYSILFQNKIKRLYTTVHFTYPRPTLTFSADVPDFEVYSSTLETDPTMRTVQVTLRNRILGSVDPFINSQPYHRIVNHSRLLSTRLFGKKRSYQTLDIRWNLLTVPIPFSFSRDTSVGKSMVRSKYDQAYIDLHRSWTSKSQYCKARRLLLEKMGARNPEYREKGVIKVGAGKLKSASFCGEVLLIVESAILELQLWHEEHLFASMGEGSVLRQILPECIGAIQSRMTSDRKQALARYNGYQWKDDSVVELNRQWECIEQMLIRLRESNDLHLDAAELRDRAIRELPDADSSSAQMLTRSLGNMVTDCRLNMWFMAMSKIISDSSSSITRTTSLSSDASELDYRVDTPRPSQILDSLMRLFLFRLKKILTHGFSMAQRYPTIWKTFLQVLDSSAWEPFIEFSCLSDYTSEIVQCHRGSPLYVVEVDAETYHETQEGGEQKEEQIPAEDIPWTARTTSLVVRNASFDFDHALQQAITDSLKHAPNIICLGGIPELGLDETCRQQPYRAVYTNRRAWKGRALARSSFDYTVGFESQNSGDIQTRGNHVRLFGTARCLTLFHCPSSGKLTVSLFVRRRSGRITLNATLRSDSDPASANTIQYVVPTREKKGGLLCAAIHFTDVSQGGGQILIEGDRFWKVHEVKVQWIAGDKVEDVGAGNCNPEWAGLSKEPGETELDPDARSVGHEDFDERHDRQDTC